MLYCTENLIQTTTRVRWLPRTFFNANKINAPKKNLFKFLKKLILKACELSTLLFML